jgi:predicted metalloprotease with PDZ domain
VSSRRAPRALAALAAASLLGCRTPPPPPPSPLTPLPPALAAPATPAGPLWRYEITLGKDASELQVEACFPAATPTRFVVEEGADRYVREVDVASAGSWTRVQADHGGFTLPACAEQGCRLRYRVELAGLARHFDDIDQALATHGTYLATPPHWLLHPSEEVEGARGRLHVTAPAGQRFVTGVTPAGDAADTYEADAAELSYGPYTGFGPFRVHSVPVAGGRIELAVVPGDFALPDSELVAWAGRSARIISTYFGRFPVSHLALFVVPERGSGVGLGTTMGHGGAAIGVYLGEHATADDLREDWVLPHEMIHLAMSQLPRRFRWFKEGAATYIEPIAEVRAGSGKPEDVWRQFVSRMEDGLPGHFDRGIDRTPSWGRVYWGGALFCLLADIEIRKRSGNRRSLDDAFRAIVTGGGTIENSWSLEHLLREGDRATGLTVLTDLHAQWAEQAVAVDLPALWRRLGVVGDGDSVRFDDRAELAAVRRAITAPPDLGFSK